MRLHHWRYATNPYSPLRGITAKRLVEAPAGRVANGLPGQGLRGTYTYGGGTYGVRISAPPPAPTSLEQPQHFGEDSGMTDSLGDFMPGRDPSYNYPR